MPRSSLDWLGVVSGWVGALIMALKAGDLPLLSGAPAFLASDVWAYLPLALISLAMAIFLYRVVRPSTAQTPQQVTYQAPRPPIFTKDQKDFLIQSVVILIFVVVIGSGFMAFIRLAAETGSQQRAEASAAEAQGDAVDAPSPR